MPFPDFRADGWLPEGHHAATWEEIVAVFGGEPGSPRAVLMQRLLDWRDALRARTITGLLILNGSFISTKSRPGDVDAIFVFDATAVPIVKNDDEAKALIDIVLNKQSGLGDIFVYARPTVEQFPQFCRIDGFDLNKISNEPKGVLEVHIMITDENNLRGVLHQMSSFSDMLYALYLDSERTGDWELFPLISKGYFHRIRELNVEVQEWLQTQRQEEQTAAREEVATAA